MVDIVHIVVAAADDAADTGPSCFTRLDRLASGEPTRPAMRRRVQDTAGGVLDVLSQCDIMTAAVLLMTCGTTAKRPLPAQGETDAGRSVSSAVV